MIDAARSPADRATVFERRMAADHTLVSSLRHDLAVELSDRAAPSLVSDALLVVSELITNAITAARTSSDDLIIRVRAPEDDALVVEVEDPGPGFTLDRKGQRVDADEEHGRGLRIVAAVADDMQVDRFDKRTLVRALLRRHEAFELAGDLE